MLREWKQSAILWPSLFVLVFHKQQERQNSVDTANNGKQHFAVWMSLTGYITGLHNCVVYLLLWATQIDSMCISFLAKDDVDAAHTHTQHTNMPSVGYFKWDRPFSLPPPGLLISTPLIQLSVYFCIFLPLLVSLTVQMSCHEMINTEAAFPQQSSNICVIVLAFLSIQETINTGLDKSIGGVQRQYSQH